MNKKLPNVIRDVSPCKGCEEKFAACHDRCPKDARGEYGFGAWRAEVDRVNKARHQYEEQQSGVRFCNLGG